MRSDIDEAIVLLKRGGDDALERAVALLQGAVFAFSMRVCGQQQDAEDTMQEVLVKSLPYLSKFDNSRALATWLYKVAKNRCLMNRRKSKFAPKEELSLEELMPNREEFERLDGLTTVTPEGSAIRGEQGQRLREAIRHLPPHYRIILVLRDMEGFTDEEVGEITGLRPGTIRVRLHRARLFVRRELAKVNEGVKQGITGRLQRNAGAPSGTGGCRKFLRNLESTIQRCQQSPADCPDRERAAGLRKKLLATYSRALATRWK
jgi:RNA polymerase sigma-70 factor (ECF subfamily)